MRDHDHLRPRRRLSVICTVTAGLTAAACSLILPAGASAAPTGARAPTAAVSPTPASGTPELAKTTAVQTVRQLVQCGTTMFAVGSFTEIKQGAKTYARNNIFSFSATSPYAVTGWDPNVNGEVNSIAFNGGNCSDAYIGGQFSSVGGTTANNIAEISTSTGAVVSAFGSNTGGGHVDTLLAVNGHLLVGGTFTGINGSSTNPYFASVSPTTGKDDGFLHLNVSGHYVYPKVMTNTTEVYNQQLSHSGTLDLVEGTFTSVGGKARQQIFMLNVGVSPATVTGWSSPEFDGSKGNLPGGYNYQCADSHPLYIRAAAWGPGDTEVYVADTGFRPWNWNGKFPLTNLCDAAAAFPATQTEVTHDWLVSTGCDSFYSVAADNFAVYVGGHNRWIPNPNACNAQGSGSTPDPGLAGLTPGPSGGVLIKNTAGTAGLYSRSRGHGADDMLLTSAGLWIASDDFGGGTQCGGVSGFSGICFLPYS